jgi:type II secretion system protein N
MNIKKILQYSGYAAFGLFIFVFFTYLNFPYNKLKDTLFSAIRQQTGLSIEADDLRSTLSFGVILSDVHIQHDRMSLPDIKIAEIKATPSLLSLVTLQPKIKLSIDLKTGMIKGFFQQKGGQHQAVGILFDEFSLKNPLIQEFTKLPLNGRLNAFMNVSGNLQTKADLSGETRITLSNFKLEKTTVMNMPLPEIKISKANVAGHLQKNKFILKKLDIGSDKDDLQADGSGDIMLNPRKMGDSRLNLSFKFKLSKKLQSEFALFLPFIDKSKQKDGFYHLKISGRLSSPLALPDKS